MKVLLIKTLFLRGSQEWVAVTRLLWFVLVLIAYLGVAGVLYVLPLPPFTKRKWRAANTGLWSRVLIPHLGLRVFIENPKKWEAVKDRRQLIVSNHLSYIDILALSSQISTVFVTSSDLEKTFLGPIAAAGGSLFVNRNTPAYLLSEIKQTAMQLLNGLNVTIFPEATTSNGEQVLPFKRGLLEAALHAQMDILPICINYTLPDGSAMPRQLRDSLFYYGDMDFLEHLWRLIRIPAVDIRIKILDHLPVQEYRCARILARSAHQQITASFLPVAV